MGEIRSIEKKEDYKGEYLEFFDDNGRLCMTGRPEKDYKGDRYWQYRDESGQVCGTSSRQNDYNGDYLQFCSKEGTESGRAIFQQDSLGSVLVYQDDKGEAYANSRRDQSQFWKERYVVSYKKDEIPISQGEHSCAISFLSFVGPILGMVLWGILGWWALSFLFNSSGSNDFLIEEDLLGSSMESPLTIRGLGSVRIGMDVDKFKEGLSGIPECGYIKTKKENGIALIVLKGKIDGIEVMDPEVRTRSGIGVGDSKEKVRRTYYGRISDVRDGSLMYNPLDVNDKDYSMIFSFQDERVSSIKSGILSCLSQEKEPAARPIIEPQYEEF